MADEQQHPCGECDSPTDENELKVSPVDDDLYLCAECWNTSPSGAAAEKPWQEDGDDYDEHEPWVP